MKLIGDDKIILSSFIVAFCAFTAIYITQPILPLIERDFNASSFQSSLTISLVLAGITLGCIPSGILSERFPIKFLALPAAILLIICLIACAYSSDLNTLVSLRFCQGFLIPFLTSAVAASLSKSVSNKNVVRGIAWYVTATILGGMSGRLLGGFSSSLYHWEVSFLLSALLILLSCLVISQLSPTIADLHPEKKGVVSYQMVALNKDLWPSFCCAFLGQGIFSAIFNTIPFRLESGPLNLSSQFISLIYCVYIIGIFVGPLTGRLAEKIGSIKTLYGGGIILALSISILTGDGIAHVIIGLSGICFGFFMVHTNATARLNRLSKIGLGRANSLYMIFYYLGASGGSVWAIIIYQAKDWNSLIFISLILTLFLIITGREKS